MPPVDRQPSGQQRNAQDHEGHPTQHALELPEEFQVEADVHGSEDAVAWRIRSRACCKFERNAPVGPLTILPHRQLLGVDLRQRLGGQVHLGQVRTRRGVDGVACLVVDGVAHPVVPRHRIGKLLPQRVAVHVVALTQGLGQGRDDRVQFMRVLLRKVMLQRSDDGPLETEEHQGDGRADQCRHAQGERSGTAPPGRPDLLGVANGRRLRFRGRHRCRACSPCRARCGSAWG